MVHTLARRAIIAGAALSLAAGCSGTSLSPDQSSATTPSSYRAPAGMRVLPGPVVAGPIFVPLVPRKSNAPAGWPDPKEHRALLFASDQTTNTVLIFLAHKPNGSPIGSITTGINGPAGLAVDNSSALYVANIGNSTVTVYPKKQSSPSLTISTGISSPYGIAVDSKGNVFVSNLGTNDVTAYAAGQTSPYETISFNAYGQAVGLGVDAGDNIWVACDSTNGVFEIPAGTTNVQNSGLTSLNGPIGVAFGKQDVIYVSNFAASDVNIYTYGSTSPSGTITNGIETNGPTLGAFTHHGAYFQSNQGDNIVGYKKNQTSPFSTLTDTGPLGIASSPLIKK